MGSSLVYDEWIAEVSWEGGDEEEEALKPSHPLLLNLNDPNMVFTAKDPSSLAHAASIVKSAPARTKVIHGPPIDKHDDLAVELSRFNVSKDKEYGHSKRAEDKSGVKLQVRVEHATPAMKVIISIRYQSTLTLNPC